MGLRAIAFAALLFMASTSLSAQSGTVGVTTLGAACDYDRSAHPTDDAPVLQKILDGVIKRPDGTRYESLSFPVGRCYIRQALTVRDFSLSLFGTGTAANTGLVADFAPDAWRGSSKVALTLAPTAPGFALGEKLQGFSISGVHNRATVSTGLSIRGVGAPLYIKGLDVSGLVIQNFDTCAQVTNTIQSTFETVRLAFCRVGLDLLGQNVNITVDHLAADSFGHTSTSSTGMTVGLSIEEGADGPGPEGISLINSSILGADTNLDVGQVLQLTILNDILDFANHDAVVLRNPNDIQIHDCYISSVGKADSIVVIADGTNLDGITISDSFLNGVSTRYGILLSGGIHRDMHIERNRIQGAARAMQFNVMPTYSTISGNYGYANSGPFITVADTARDCGEGTRIELNTSTDALPILESHCAAAAFSLGYNASPSQQLGR